MKMHLQHMHLDQAYMRHELNLMHHCIGLQQEVHGLFFGTYLVSFPSTHQESSDRDSFVIFT